MQSPANAHRILAQACDAISQNRLEEAQSIVANNYGFQILTSGRTTVPLALSMQVFWEDGFIDRYSGRALVNCGALRLLSHLLGEKTFPFHPHGKFDQCHQAFWELLPSVDHVVPVARGGANDRSNLVTTSMACNQAKGLFSIEEMGWTMKPPGKRSEWDGLSTWLVEYVDRQPDLAKIDLIGKWARVSKPLVQGRPLPLTERWASDESDGGLPVRVIDIDQGT